MSVRLLAMLFVGAAIAVPLGCRTVEKSVVASNHRDWSPDQATLSRAVFKGDEVAISNVRYCKHLGPGEYVVDHDDRKYDLRQLRGVDFIAMPFGPIPAVAHTMLSFEFAPTPPLNEPQYLAVSVEVRREKGEEGFNPVSGLSQQYEIMYVIADERDALYSRAVANDVPTYLYRTTASPQAARELLTSMLDRANQLTTEPQFYNLLTNNCTTNIAEHVNLIRPNKIVFDVGVLLPGLSAQKAYNEGLLVTRAGETFEQLQARSLINTRARVAANNPKLDFSEAIRR